ncbi:MAG: OmpA family protein [Betaproteobacteria bacterium]|nr:OmpA family protein [Betaproteobacteria bacterium]
MRASLSATLLLSALLAACSTKGDIPPSKHISQSGPLRVHPGLLGKPVPAELQQETPTATAKPAAATTETQIKMDAVGLRTQRSVYFDINSADIKSDYDPALRAHARYLAEHPTARVRIEGNADERGSADYNQRLGLKRAENVRATLISQGAADNQVKIKSLGEAKPKLTGHDESSWSENRRADVVYEVEN